jgi:hypothetical protein
VTDEGRVASVCRVQPFGCKIYRTEVRYTEQNHQTVSLGGDQIGQEFGSQAHHSRIKPILAAGALGLPSSTVHNTGHNSLPPRAGHGLQSQSLKVSTPHQHWLPTSDNGSNADGSILLSQLVWAVPHAWPVGNTIRVVNRQLLIADDSSLSFQVASRCLRHCGPMAMLTMVEWTCKLNLSGL